ncbi:hypothetical protein ACMATS_06210 [Streptoverticillium reticulum]|uniref:hypothetical protein n=1 Tax=Streptoverticillium reticulum TaxID=1433415 RepID=UPI0039BF3ED6
MPHPTSTHYPPDEARKIINDLTEVYAKVYDAPPYIGDPFFSVATFIERLTAAFDMKGFEVVTAHLDDGTLVGYVHGVTLSFPRDAESVDRGSDGTHERTFDHGCPEKISAGVA